MKPDLTNKADIRIVVDEFYGKIKSDPVVGIFFTKVVAINWEAHLPTMCAFWENVLFYTGEYEGNPLDTHRKIHLQYHTRPEHFNRWLELFDETIDRHYAGPNADKMKYRAKAIATVMQQKM
ncbi:group III truncated hemoglobin [Chitinophaga eiseniae]|uniref:Group III truncated hemoglobin n=1 Tax=Chitinophaga eiseniae TaxID=634771 RepID=A0A847SGS4_9BACT|nr:group III truncated hemoglobin [Chitinophaga eiseniae]NLR78225.1 group III truncated hemoglobin [Chitinophaga eiseniae]